VARTWPRKFRTFECSAAPTLTTRFRDLLPPKEVERFQALWY
jgi:hypothetical protein